MSALGAGEQLRQTPGAASWMSHTTENKADRETQITTLQHLENWRLFPLRGECEEPFGQAACFLLRRYGHKSFTNLSQVDSCGKQILTIKRRDFIPPPTHSNATSSRNHPELDRIMESKSQAKST